VRVPEEAGNGKAKVTLSFTDWKEGRVAPVTIFVPVVDKPPAPEESKEGDTID
jgi:hypothetical protein